MFMFWNKFNYVQTEVVDLISLTYEPGASERIICGILMTKKAINRTKSKETKMMITYFLTCGHNICLTDFLGSVIQGLNDVSGRLQ